jgi:hypothetical protein
MIISCLWLSPKYVKDLTLFLRGLALFAVVRDQVLSFWLVIFRPATRRCRLWEYLHNYPFEDPTSPGCWARRLHSFSLYLNLDDSTPGRITTLCFKNPCWRRCQQAEDCNICDQPKPIGWIGQNSIALIELPPRISHPWVLVLPCLVWWLLVVP